jgi:hypothetical protein
MHPTQHAKPPDGAQWQYEIKLDGWRGQLHLRNGAAFWAPRMATVSPTPVAYSSICNRS